MKTSQKFNIDFDYNELHHDAPKAVQAPLIGLTGNFSDNKFSLLPGYYTSILKAGAVPVILPPTEDADILISFLNRIDGLLFTGGADINPLFFQEEPIRELQDINPYRDRQELLLARLAADRQIPILHLQRSTGFECCLRRKPLSRYPLTNGRNTHQT